MASTAVMKRTPGTTVATGQAPNERIQRLTILATQLKNARQTFESTWIEIAQVFRPRRIRLQVSDRNKGDRRNQKIVDSTPVYAARTCASGLMSGMTSAARIWFKMTVSDKALLEHASVKVWLEDVREVIARILSRSNFYATLQTFYSDLAVFGTACMLIEEDEQKVIRCTHFAVGEYWIGYNARQQVRVFMREYELTVQQAVEQFGRLVGDTYDTANLSPAIVQLWNAGQTQKGVVITHIIYENPDHDPQRLQAKYKRYASCYYETAGPKDRFLDEGGYNEWPVMAVRWETTTGDVYGTDCPGITAIGDVKELMFSKKIGAQALNKAVNPPMVAPMAFRNLPLTQLPGGVTYGDETAEKKMRPAVDTSSFRLDWLSKWTDDIKALIDRAFFVDLFMVIANIDKANTTATEILEKKEEKLLSLGPVVEQVNDGFLDPAMDRVYGIALRRGLIPEPPPELSDVEFHPEYESIMAQAQRAQGRTGIEAFAVFCLNAAKIDPTILDRVDADEMVEKYGEASGVPPKFIRSDDAVQAIRGARAKQQAQAEAAANAESVATSANKLAGADTSGKNALTDLLAAGAGSGGVLGGAQGGF